MSIDPVTKGRRRFLQGLGAAALAAPLLPYGSPKASAQTQKKLILVTAGNSFVHRDIWQPGAGFALPDILAPLRGLEDQMLFLDGMSNHTGNGHDAAGGMYTGHPNHIPDPSRAFAFTNPGTSIDYHVAGRLGGAVRVPVLHGGALVNFGSGSGHLFPNYNRGVREPFIADPRVLYTTAFGTAPIGGMTGEMEPVAQRRRRRVLEATREQLTGEIAANAGIRRTRFETHLRQVESELSLLAPPAPVAVCSPSMPALPTGYPSAARALERDSGAMNQWANETLHAQADIIAQALRCGTTRVATFQIGDSGQQMAYPGTVDPSIRYSNHAHDLIHAVSGTSSPDWNARLKFEQWVSAHVRYLVDAVGADISNTLIVYCRPIGFNHDTTNVPAILIGGDGAMFTPRRYANMGGASHLGLLRAVGQIMGVDMAGFGDPSNTAAAFDLGQ